MKTLHAKIYPLIYVTLNQPATYLERVKVHFKAKHVPDLMKVLNDPQTDLLSKSTILNILEKMGASAKKALPNLRDIARDIAAKYDVDTDKEILEYHEEIIRLIGKLQRN